MMGVEWECCFKVVAKAASIRFACSDASCVAHDGGNILPDVGPIRYRGSSLMSMQHLLEPAVFASLPGWLAEHGHPAYRAAQVRQWLFASRAESFEEMTNLPKPLRERLAQEFAIWTTTIERHHRAADGTEKLLLRLHDGHHIECVLLRDGGRRTICISSQVGCAMGCVFCASGLDGVVRNLAAGEIVEQMLRLARLLPASGNAAASTAGTLDLQSERLSHIVVLGMGEPLANLDRLLAALGEATRPDGPG